MAGIEFTANAAEFHNYILKAIAKNMAAESKTQPHANDNNWYIDFSALSDNIEGVLVNTLDGVKTDNTLEYLYYSGKNIQNVWWEEFEIFLNGSFMTYDQREKIIAHYKLMEIIRLSATGKGVHEDWTYQE